MKHIICFSGGEASALAAIEAERKYGKENIILLNHNINPKYEDQDIKRFKKEVADYLGLPITYANYGGIRDENLLPSQFEVALKKKGFKGYNNTEFCTYELKTKPFYQYLEDNFPEKDCIVYYGFGEDELHRVERRKTILNDIEIMSDYPLAIWGGRQYTALIQYFHGQGKQFSSIALIEKYRDTSGYNRTITSTIEIGIRPPNTYSVWKHANCVGCLKAGKQHWYCVYVHRRDIFEEAKEAESIIGHSIIAEGVWLKDLEKDFEKMLIAGVPANEHIPDGKFWKTARKYTKKGLQDMFPCECWSA
jgi:hypothetical protein